MASKLKVAAQAKEETPEKETEGAPDTPLPLLDLSDAGVKKMIKAAKKRGYVTYEQLNAVMPSEEVTSEQIEDTLAMLSEMGINVIENEDADTEEGEEKATDEVADDDDDDTGNELVEAKSKSLATTEKKEPSERTDDPVRMYLREMGSVELLSREGEIAIAKRIEAGREAMIAGLCESPLTFQAVIIWRDELSEGKVFLRDIIDLEATYAGPDAKQGPAMNGDGSAAPNGAGNPGAPHLQVVQTAAPPAAPPAATPFKAKPESNDNEEAKDPAETAAEGDYDDDDDMESSLSLAAIEAELKPKVVETFDTIADTFKRLRRLQEQDIENRLRNSSLSPAQERKYKKLKEEIITEVKSLRLNQARIDSLVEQLYDINKRLVSNEGRLMRLGESPTASRARTSCATTWATSSTRAGSTASPSFPQEAGRTSSPTRRSGSRTSAAWCTTSRRRPASRSPSSARSCRWCRRASARRARPRRRWWRRTCASSSPSPRNTPTAACSSST